MIQDNPIPCETEVIPREGAVVTIDHGEYPGDYVVNEIETKHVATQPGHTGPLKMTSEVLVYLTAK
ncbi:hypothetical protein [Halobacillus litoralis]|uniref:hypothetical protein n=1 Tax=Halobacillus litoralis TaxID=45668 RepID=UPI001CFF073D|nr:hypothetical protein [Halobacillus litoralis]